MFTQIFKKNSPKNSSDFKIVHEENRMTNVIRFSIETIQGMEFWKTSGYFLAVFPQITIVFQWMQFKISFPLIFCFASFDGFKALTGCSEKLEI